MNHRGLIPYIKPYIYMLLQRSVMLWKQWAPYGALNAFYLSLMFQLLCQVSKLIFYYTKGFLLQNFRNSKCRKISYDLFSNHTLHPDRLNMTTVSWQQKEYLAPSVTLSFYYQRTLERCYYSYQVYHSPGKQIQTGQQKNTKESI